MSDIKPQDRYKDQRLIHETSDIRRRLRLREGIAKYTFTTLFEALRARGKYVKHSTIMLLGFPQAETSSSASVHAEEIRTILGESGASVREINSATVSEDELKGTLKGADAVIIATDHRVFRALRPREFRELGIDVVIPTTLHA